MKRSSPRRRLALRVLKPLAAFLAWNLGISVLLASAAVLGLPLYWVLPAGALLFAWFLSGYVLRSGRPGEARRRAVLRLRPLSGGALWATLCAIPVVLALSLALGEVWTRLVPVPPDTFQPFRTLTGMPSGRLVVTLFALVSAPILEELVFRGLVQRPLERRWGPAPAIAFAAVVFAVFHGLLWVLPIHVFLGLSFGYAVYATRSIWAGVILHAGNNAFAALSLGSEGPTLPPTIWQTGVTLELWNALAMLGVSSLAAVWVGRWLWRAGRNGSAKVRGAKVRK